MESTGKGYSLEDAMTKAIGECIERYCLRWPDEERCIEATYHEMVANDGVSVVDFQYLDIFEFPEESNVEPPSKEVPIKWVPGTDLSTGEEWYVPAQLVWFVQATFVDQPDPQFHSTSNGVAAGASPEMALKNALLELVERDAIMRTWFQRSTPTAISLSSFPTVREQVEQLMPVDDSLSLHLVKVDSKINIPAVASLIVNERDEFPKFIIGGDSALTWSDALSGAALEVGQGWPIIRMAYAEDFRDLSIDSLIDNLDDNFLLYAQPEQFDKVKFLLGSERDQPYTPAEITMESPASHAEGLDICLEEFSRANCRPIAFDLTTPDIRQVGIHVVRVFVPELVPLSVPSYPPTNHPDLINEECSSLPHPFP